MLGTDVTSLISSTIDILKASRENYQVVKDDKDLREAFHEAGRVLHFVEEALQTASTQLDGSDLLEIPQSAMILLDACNTKAKLSESISKYVAQGPETTRLERYKEAVYQHGNGKMAEVLALEMMQDVCDLAENDAINVEMVHHVKQLHAAIDKLSKMEPSVPKESLGNMFSAYGDARQFNTLSVYGDSHQFNALDGSQYNNDRGNQFPGATFSGPVSFAKSP
jgi:hypothetical protein